MSAADVLFPTTGLHLTVVQPDGPLRGTIYALHGGGLSGSYWDFPLEPSLSLARLAASVGFRVAYPDRPGHQANAERWPGGLPAVQESELHAATIRECFPEGPVFVIGQSAGAMITVLLAATQQVPNLAGIEFSGIGLHLDRDREHDGPFVERFWGPMRMYPAAVFTKEGRAVTSPIIEADGVSAQSWWQVFPNVGPQVTVPVRITMVDTEAWWGPIPDALAELQGGFSASPRVETNVEFAAPHNLSISWAARSYHLGALSFFERCLRV